MATKLFFYFVLALSVLNVVLGRPQDPFAKSQKDPNQAGEGEDLKTASSYGFGYGLGYGYPYGYYGLHDFGYAYPFYNYYGGYYGYPFYGYKRF